jgi:hypothetical protein
VFGSAASWLSTLTPVDSRPAMVAFAKGHSTEIAKRLKRAHIDIAVYPHGIRISPSVSNDQGDIEKLSSWGFTLALFHAISAKRRFSGKFGTYSIRTQLAIQINHLQAFRRPVITSISRYLVVVLVHMHRAERLMYVHSEFLPTRSVATQ